MITIKEKEYNQHSLPRPVKGGGYVYVILASNGNIKIGRTANPYKRIQEIKNYANQFDVTLKRIYITPPNPFYVNLEEELHRRYEQARYKGEWFKGLSFEEVSRDVDMLCKGYITSYYNYCIKELDFIRSGEINA